MFTTDFTDAFPILSSASSVVVRRSLLSPETDLSLAARVPVTAFTGQFFPLSGSERENKICVFSAYAGRPGGTEAASGIFTTDFADFTEGYSFLESASSVVRRLVCITSCMHELKKFPEPA